MEYFWCLVILMRNKIYYGEFVKEYRFILRFVFIRIGGYEFIVLGLYELRILFFGIIVNVFLKRNFM